MRVCADPPAQPKDGHRDDGGRDGRGCCLRSGAPKFHCDNALTGSQSGLYCAPLAAKAARCGAAAGGPDEASASARAQDARSKKGG